MGVEKKEMYPHTTGVGWRDGKMDQYLLSYRMKCLILSFRAHTDILAHVPTFYASPVHFLSDCLAFFD